MLNQCPNCGGGLVFDIPSGKVVCSFCDSSFEPDALEDATRAQEVTDMPEYEADLFVCPACGAEISSTALDAVNYCLYCGSFVSLEKQMRRVKRPDEIVPFTKTKEDCKALYRSGLRDRIYGRGEFKKQEFLEGFKPIYIPYWNYDFRVGPEIKTQKVTTEIKGDYEYGQKDYICYKAQGTFTGTGFDASSTFDDAIGYDIGLYDREKARPFHPAYMFGFFGDTADVSSDVYEKTTSQKMADYVYYYINGNEEIRKGGGDMDRKKLNDWACFSVSEKLTMLPVWFLTWRKGNRVAYSVMNGESGAMHTEIPISIIRYLVLSLITAVPIFFLLNMNFTFMGHELLNIALALSSMTLLLHMSEMERIIARSLHFNDKGYLAVHKKARADKKAYRGSLLVSLLEGIQSLFVTSFKLGVGLSVIIGCIIWHFLESTDIRMPAMGFCSLVVPILVVLHNRKCKKYLPDQRIWIDTAGALVAAVVSGITLVENPVGDIYYYFCGIGCLAGVALTAIMTMRRYNDLITRPVPHFFDRETGGKG